MEKIQLLHKLQHRFGLIYSDEYLKTKINEYGDNYRTLVFNINEDFKKSWYNQEIDWLIEYINNNFYDCLTAEINFDQIKKIVRYLIQNRVRINYNIFLILMDSCPILEDIFISILGYKDSYNNEDIIKASEQLEFQKMLIYYCCYHDRWQGTLMHKETIKLSNARVKVDMMAKEEILSKDEEKELLQKVKMGDEEARNILIRKNMPLVYVIARKYAYRGVELNDLMQQGMLGLMVAIDNFDSMRGGKLSTYAYVSIRNEIKYLIYSLTNQFYISSNLRPKYAQFKYEMETMVKENKVLSASDLCTKLNISNNTLNEFIKITKPIMDSDDIKLMEAYTGSYEYDISLEMELKEIVNNLPEEQKKVIAYIYGFNGKKLNGHEIGKSLGISRQYVDFLHHLALKKITLIFYILGYKITSFDKYLKEIPSYQEFNNQYYKVRYINPRIQNKQINQYSWLAYNLGLISFRTVIYLSALKDEEIANYLVNLLYGQNTYNDIQQKYFQKNRILKK